MRRSVFAVFRMGVGGTVVDNAGAGGIIAAVDPETGTVMSCGYREDGTTDETDPDTGASIEGSSIPSWDELREMVEQLVQIMPEQPLVGWDLALTDAGWVMAEGNSAPVVHRHSDVHPARHPRAGRRGIWTVRRRKDRHEQHSNYSEAGFGFV